MTRLLMAAQVEILNVVHAMQVHVHLGWIGPNGVTVPLTAMVVLNRGPEPVSMIWATKLLRMTVLEQILTKNNAIDNHVMILILEL